MDESRQRSRRMPAWHVRRCAGWLVNARHHTAPGQGLVEYALILVLIAVVTIGSLRALGNGVNDSFNQVNCMMSGGTWHSDNGNGNSSRCR